MAEIHHFSYGWFHPVVAFLVAYLGWTLGLFCTARAREARVYGRRSRWLLIATVAAAGAGVWLTHFLALLGVQVPASTLRFDPLYTAASAAAAVVPLGLALLVSRHGAGRSAPRLLAGGLLAALAVFGTQLTGVLGLRVAGAIHLDPAWLAAAAAAAAVSAGLAMWFTVAVRGWAATLVAGAAMAAAMSVVTYSAVASLRVRLAPEPVDVTGTSPFLLVVPITVLVALALIGMAVTALQAMTEEEFDGAVPGRHRGGAEPAAALPAVPGVTTLMG